MDETPRTPPRVSVLTVSYNCADALRCCLRALEASQGRDTLEIIVVDNGSRDESGNLDTEFPNTTFLRLPRNFGLTKARNIGVRSASAEYVFFLQPHIEVQPETVTALAAVLDGDLEAWAAVPLLVTAGGTPSPLIYRLPDAATVYAACNRGGLEPLAVDPDAGTSPVECASGVSFMVRRHYLKGMNYLDERFGEYWSDIELCFQIRRSSKKILLATGARAVRHDDLSRPQHAAGRAQLSADCALGAAHYAGKHGGFVTGILFRLRVIFGGLGQAFLGLGDIAYHFSRVKYLMSGQKIDGSQTSL